MGGIWISTLQKSNKSNTKFIGRGGFDFYNLQTDVLMPSVLQFEAVNKGQSIQGFTKNLNTNYIFSLVNTLSPSEQIIIEYLCRNYPGNRQL